MKYSNFSTRILLLVAVTSAMLPSIVSGQEIETLWYLPGSGESRLQEARDHIDQISILAPQAFRSSADGEVTGHVSDSLLILARDYGRKVMPLIVNPGFNQQLMHDLLVNPEARRRAITSMVDLAKEHGFWGWQFDFENIHVTDRDALTVFYRETADALHAEGFKLSIAVVPTNGGSGDTDFGQYMQDNWRNSYDVAALAEIGDFVSWMTYAQHGGPTAPGPIGGEPWIREMIDYALAQGVPVEKISLGVGTYSGYWYPGHNEERGSRVIGREIPFWRAVELLEESGASLTWLPDQGVSYTFWQNEGVFEWLFLENRRSFAHKMEIFRAYPGFRGISVWVLGAEDPDIWTVLREFSIK